MRIKKPNGDVLTTSQEDAQLPPSRISCLKEPMSGGISRSSDPPRHQVTQRLGAQALERAVTNNIAFHKCHDAASDLPPFGPKPPAPVSSFVDNRDVLEHMMRRLSAEDLQNARLVCRSWAAAGQDPSTPGWRELLHAALDRATRPRQIVTLLGEAANRGVLDYVTELFLSRKGLHRQHIKEICEIFAGRRSPQLNLLDLGYNNVNAGVLHLAVATPLRGLKHLNLCSNHIDVAGVQALAASTVLTSLQFLNLGSNCMGAKGAEALATSANLRSVLHLNLSYNDVGDIGAQALAASVHLKSVVHFDLSQNCLSSRGAAALAASERLSSTLHIDLSCNGIGSVGAQLLLASAHLAGLQYLDLSYDDIRDAGAQALAASTHLGSVLYLKLKYNGIGNAGAQALVTSAHLAGLQYLDLSYNEIGDGGALVLSTATHLRSLIYLDLQYNRIGAAGALSLSCATQLESLQYLNLRYNNIGAAHVEVAANFRNIAPQVAIAC